VNSVSPRYLVVVGHYNHMGGAERQAFHLIKHLRQEMNASVAVLGWSGDGPLVALLRELKCEVFNFPYKPISSRQAKAISLFRMARFIRTRIKPDYIFPFVSVNSKPICQIWRLTGARYAWWNQQDEGRSLYGTNAERKALLNAVHITSNSLAGTEFIATTYDIPENQILTYNNGTVLPNLTSIKPIWRKKLGLAEETPLVSMLANITPFKDHETLLRAWKLVLDEFSRLSRAAPFLALAGFTKKTSHVNKLKVLAFDLKLGTSMAFLDAIDTTNELMFESDLVVHSSMTEGCPNSVCEGMALGKPVVGTDITGMRQALDKSLWQRCLSKPHDHIKLAEQIIQILIDNSLANEIGAMNRKRIKDYFSIEKMCELLVSLPNTEVR